MSSTESRKRCPECEAKEVHHRTTQANGGHGPMLLRGLGRIFKPAMMDVYVCARCGHIRMFAEDAARQRLKDTQAWRKLT